ncbi:anti-sigma factor [Seonamhaeicola aphaedonensis]|uniref:Anti-sigma-K factor rskA n=1 Tax=Seonamhaeicola aphaedonensis TaxID=1461338 RepID=A0A3D9H929_9FLAO|nr:anti-sigma factor [Seonamhaeicola aphaedonensis]RED45995.1 anti-sigma-K factor rskA [Seonamhaeicola aphaedonensis]
MMIRKVILAVIALGFLTVSCSDDDNPVKTSRLTLNLDGLEALGPDYVYEGWIIVDGSPVSTGTFTSVSFPQTFTVDKEQLQNATTFVLSIEPAVDTDPAPAATKILAGDFSGDDANVNSNGIVGDFSASYGKYILATPTDTDDTNEESGVWFLDNSSGSPVAGLNLPALDAGWKYEGWVVFDGTPITTGTFTAVNAADDNAATSMFKGDAGNGPAYPGEDYLQNAPAGLTFPTDLRGKTIVISVEPDPDNSAAPFTLKPLAHMVPTDAMTHTAIMMGDGPVKSLTGVVSR